MAIGANQPEQCANRMTQRKQQQQCWQQRGSLMILLILGATTCHVNAGSSHHKLSSFWGSSTSTSRLSGEGIGPNNRLQQQQQRRRILDLPRGGAEEEEELSMEEKVHAAMRKLGMNPPADDAEQAEAECADGVCPMPGQEQEKIVADTDANIGQADSMNVEEVATQIASEMNVDRSLALAALGATTSEEAAREMIQQERNMIDQISDDLEQVKQLVEEGFDPLLTKRALAFAELDVDDARAILLIPRGGAQEEKTQAEKTLDEKVHAAMLKLGLDPPEDDEEEVEVEVETASEMPPADESGATEMSADVEPEESADGVMPEEQATVETNTATEPMDVNAVATQIASEMNVDRSLAMAALGATSTVPGASLSRAYNEEAAREMIQQELNMINQVSDESEEVKQLVEEGFDSFLSRRALAFAELDIDNARAILIADQMDEEEEEEDQRQQQQQQQQQEQEERANAEPARQEMKMVTVDSNFDPTKVNAPAASELPNVAPPQQSKPTKPAKKSDVVFEATAATVQELVLESPVPVLLDIYADWCGPCKVLGPALEEMAVKSGGVFRLVKINSDNEKAVATALEIESLPTVFGIKDGKILNSFKGMPRSEDVIKNFMMGLLMPGAKFKPPLTETEHEKYTELSGKLVKVAGAASFPFSAREGLQARIATKLDELAELTGDLSKAEESATVLRSLLSNVLKDPYEVKFRSVNLANKVLASKLTKFAPCVAILKSVGFGASADGQSMMLGRGKKMVNVAPVQVARDCIDKWIDNNRYNIGKAARKRKDEDEKARLHAEGAFDVEEEDSDDEPEEEVDPNVCSLKLRLTGKKKVHDVILQADEPLKAILKSLPVSVKDDDEVQITCIAKRLVIKSLQDKRMKSSLRELGLMPAASIVVSVSTGAEKEAGTSTLSERAAVQKKKKGTHTMQSVGIYSKDDNLKGELIDGGGGTWYEQDVTDDEEEEQETAVADEEEINEVEDEDTDSSDESGSSESE